MFSHVGALIALFLYFSSLVTATPAPVAGGKCTTAKRIAGTKALIKVIHTHSQADAELIPLAPFCTRTIYVSPKEAGNNVQFPVNVGVDAVTVREELVGLATLIIADVKGPVTYIANKNGSITADLVQTDFPELPYEPLREIHDFDLKTCQMTKITGYITGKVLPKGIPK